MPVLKQEAKVKKKETEDPTKKDTTPVVTRNSPPAGTGRQDEPSTSWGLPVVSAERQPVPSTSHAPTTSSAEVQPEEDLNVMEELTVRRDDEVDESKKVRLPKDMH